MAAKQTKTSPRSIAGANYCTEQACCKYGYLANPAGGWNPITGLGTPSYANMLAYLEANL